MNYDILIRCRNEVSWLNQTYDAINSQKSTPNKVIFVDSGSTDGSLELANSFGWEVIKYKTDKFNYSESLNIGFENSESLYVLILSAHCIFSNEEGATKMLEEFNDNKVGAVFGRQLPTKRSSPHDTRDLLTVFGRERIVYQKQPFFHNAFAMVKKSLWQTIKFDENINGIEDRIWAREIAKLGYKIIYQPEAKVYHEHGLNHGTSMERALRVLEALKILHKDDCIEFE